MRDMHSPDAPERDASRTALGVAAARAAHQLFDAGPRILEDPIATRIFTPDGLERIRRAAHYYGQRPARALRAHIALRSRYTEDRLQTAVARGVRQYVMLGAGFDTFAWRQPAWASALRIVEIDHAGTQSAKRHRFEGAGLEIPPNTTLAAVDFAHESLADALRRVGVSSDQPAFFAWLGVMMYLDEAAIDATLAAVAAFPAGSELVLTYLPPPERWPADAGAAASLAERVNRVGEPFVSYFEPGALESKLRAAGFVSVAFLGRDEAARLYFSGRPADLPVPRDTHIVAAVR